MIVPHPSHGHRTRTLVGMLLVLCGLSPIARAQEVSEPASDRKALQGRVVDESGKPLDGAMVMAFPRGVVSGRSTRTSARTNREGEFVIPDLDAGFYSVRVMSPPLIVMEGIPENGVRPGQPMNIRMARGAAITGRVVDKLGRPLTGLVVEPIPIRDAQGIRLEDGARTSRGGKVDDRGVYRLWGLESGTYILAAGHKQSFFAQPEFISDRARTYYPGTNRAGATEVTVRNGDEIADVDIEFRGDAGFLVTGSIVAAPGRAVSQQATVELFRQGMMSPERIVIARPVKGVPTFRLEAIEDGDYELVARSLDGAAYDTTDRKSIRVRGADVNGVRLELLPTSGLSGRIVEGVHDTCDTSLDGKPMPPVRLSDVMVRIRRVDGPAGGVQAAQAKSTGEFEAKPLNSGVYRLWLESADDTTYLRSLDLALQAKVTTSVKPNPSGAASTASVSSIGRDGLRINRDRPIDGVRFIVSRGAARMTGRIVPAKEGASLPARARVCLVPADEKLKDDVIRYFEVEVGRGGAFDVPNVAPGEYFVLTRDFSKDDRPDNSILPAAWDAKERVKLRAAAEKAGLRISLAPCQRLESAVVRVVASP